MTVVLRHAAHAAPDYADLLDYDERRLATGTGSKLLDAFLRVPEETRRFGVRSIPEAEAIQVADPATKADIFARLCGLTFTADSDESLWRRLPVNHLSLKTLYGALRSNMEAISLPSATVARLLWRDRDIAAKGWIDPTRETWGGTSRGEAKALVAAALRTGESVRDPDFDALLQATLARLETGFLDYSLRDLPKVIEFARLCLAAFGQPDVEPAAARALQGATEAAGRQLTQWREDAPPLLGRYIALHAGLPTPPGETSADLIAQMAQSTPEARGDLAEYVWRVGVDGECTPEGLPWTLEMVFETNFNRFSSRVNASPFNDLWKALLAQRCVLKPAFAMTLARGLEWCNWVGTLSFARSLAAALPRTAETKPMVEALFLRLSDSGHSWIDRPLGPWKAALREALAEGDQPVLIARRLSTAEDAAASRGAAKTRHRFLKEFTDPSKAPADLETRAAEARAAFERAMEESRQAKAKGDAGWGVGGGDPARLFALAVTAAKLGPVPESFTAALQELEDDLDRDKLKAGLPLGRDPASFDHAFRQLAYLALDCARCALSTFAPLTPAQREIWLAAEDLARHAPATPSAKWIAAARKLAGSPEGGVVLEIMLRLAGVAALLVMPEPYESMLGLPFAARRALLWQLAFQPGPQAASLLGQFAALTLQPADGRIVNEPMGNAALWALAEMPDGAGLPQLARLAERSRLPKVRKRIGALFETAARKSGRTRAEIEEDIAPKHDFTVDGAAGFVLPGETGSAQFRLSPRGKVAVSWRNPSGKTLKSPSAEMKRAAESVIQAVKHTAREIELDYGVQAKRVEKLYRSTRALDFARWRGAYVEHPFVGQIARRLIWRAGDLVGLWRDGRFEDVAGVRHDVSGETLTLWHPVQASEAEVLAWRERLAQLGIDQPFRQAWRETYRVTDAERATGHYSNRFAGHIVRQHQFMTLARLNDWSCRHRMWQDVANDEPTCVAFPEHGIYAEYWTAGAGGDDPPVAESTAYLYLTTDRVAFHRLDPNGRRGERLAVDEVPPLVFSEILRSCDLFVAVASIARDAQWLDRGRDAAHPSQWQAQADAYWRGASQAPLPASADIRREVLARLLPALGLGDRLTLDDRRLHVRGVRGAYAIHLGSGAAFHASGRHICIVPDGAPKKLVLPYEGDETLALILSKAMLLLSDDKIDDPVILRQL